MLAHFCKNKKKPSIAFISADGLGDSLLCASLADHLITSSNLTLFHRLADQLSPLFPSIHFEKKPEDWEKTLACFDLILVQNDHGLLCHQIDKWRKKLPPTLFLLPTPSHFAQSQDLLLTPNVPIALSMHQALSTLCKKNLLPKLKPSIHFQEKNPKQIAIHPFSSDPKRNWPLDKFLDLADRLRQKGFEPVFIMSKEERALFPLFAPLFSSLIEMAETLSSASFFIGNDSGVGHLASMLQIPTLTISPKKARVLQWRPGFCKNSIITPPFPLPNPRKPNLPFRDHYWHLFVPTFAVLRKCLSCCKLP